jgi:hypothetical protein
LRRTTIVAACSAVLATLPAAFQPATALASHALSAPEKAHKTHAAHPAPLARSVVLKLARKARALHRAHPHVKAYTFFQRLCRAWRKTHRRPAPAAVVPAVRLVARRYGFDPDGMLRVARCESNLDRRATNGQYLGLFQLGDFARARYLRGAWTDSYANAVAAARYAREAGGWGPWTCGYAY